MWCATRRAKATRCCPSKPTRASSFSTTRTRTSWPGPRPDTASSSVSRRAIRMFGSRSATADPRSPPPAPATANNVTRRHATRSHPHPSPSQTGSRAASSPPRAGRNFFWRQEALADHHAALPHSGGDPFAIRGAKKQRDQSEHRRHREAPNADARVEKRGACAADGKNGNVAGHPQQERSRVSRLYSPGPPHHVGKIDHDLCRGSGHQRRRRRASEVNAMDRILNRHRRHEHHPGDYRLPRIAIAERAKIERQGRTQYEENYLHPEQDLQRGELSPRQRRTQEPHGHHDHAENRKRK